MTETAFIDDRARGTTLLFHTAVRNPGDDECFKKIIRNSFLSPRLSSLDYETPCREKNGEGGVLAGFGGGKCGIMGNRAGKINIYIFY